MDFTKRVLILGAKSCGKSALIAQLTKEEAVTKITKLNESYQESKVTAKYMGHPSKLHLLETENAGVHFMAKTSVIMVLFDSRSHKSQKESTRIFRNICKIPQVSIQNIPIILVFTKCHDDSATKEFDRDQDFCLFSTNAETKLGVDELKLKIFRMAFPQLHHKSSSQPRLISMFNEAVESVKATALNTVLKLNTNNVEQHTFVVPNGPFQLINLPMQSSVTMSSTFSLDKVQEQFTAHKRIKRYFSSPA